MTSISCADCGIQFTVSHEFVRARREDHGTFYCPNGHSNYFPGKTKEEKRIEQLENEVMSWRENHNWAMERLHEQEREFATCPFNNCSAHTYVYANRYTLLRHLADRHGIRLIERKALPEGKTG